MPLVRPCVLLAALCLNLGVAVAVRAQASIEQVNEAVASMGSGDRDRIAAARMTLLSNLNAVRTNPPALEKFARDVANALMPVASGDDPHAKLNTAIVVQRIAEQGKSADLAPIITRLVGDSSAAVSAYGLRAASYVLPHMMAQAKSGSEESPIVPAIVKAVNAHPESEAVADEAYLAIVDMLNDRKAAEMLTPVGVAAASPRAVDALHQLLSARIAQYGSGDLAEPNAELPAISFLGKQNTYNISSSTQRVTTIRLLLQLMDASAAEMAKVPPSTPSTRLRLEALRNIFRGAAGSLSVICSPDLLNKPELKTAAQKAQQLGVATPVAEYRQTIEAIQPEFYRALPETKPSTQPTTAPAAGAPAAGMSAAPKP